MMVLAPGAGFVLFTAEPRHLEQGLARSRHSVTDPLTD